MVAARTWHGRTAVNRLVDPWKREKMDDIVLMPRGAMAAEGKVGLMINVRQTDLPAVLTILPALENPTISSSSDSEWWR